MASLLLHHGRSQAMKDVQKVSEAVAGEGRQSSLSAADERRSEKLLMDTLLKRLHAWQPAVPANSKESQTVATTGDVSTTPKVNGGADTVLMSQKHSEINFASGLMDSLTAVDVVGAAACAVLLVGILLAFVLWVRRRRHHKLLRDLTCEDGTEQLTSTKSAPPSRSPSPKLSKRSSCPDMKRAASKGVVHGGMMVKSFTVDGVPDFTLPPERVQPRLWSSSESSDFNSQQNGGNVGPTNHDLNRTQSLSDDEDSLVPNIDHSARLWFSVVFDPTCELLYVTLVKLRNLPGRGNNQPHDPFVKMFLLPDEKNSRVSSVKKNTVNPLYNETFTFQVKQPIVKQRSIRFSVYDVDKRRVRHCLGHVIVNLKDIDVSIGGVLSQDLESNIHTPSTYGDLQVSLLYLPATEKVRIGLHRARHLTQMINYPENLGTYIRIQLFYGHKCHRIKRTLTVAAGSDVTFNESLSFRVHGRQFDSCNIVISLMLTPGRPAPTVHGVSRKSPTYDRGDVTGEADVEYARLAMGPFMYARGDKLKQWQDMLGNSKTVTTRWHDLSRGISSPKLPHQLSQ